MSFCPSGKKTNSAPPPKYLSWIKGLHRGGRKREEKREGKGKRKGRKEREKTPPPK